MNPQASSPRTIQGTRLILGVILLLAFSLRLWGLDQHNIWWDEGFTAWISRLPVLRMLDRTAHDVHPPVSYLMQRGWWLLTGDGEWPMRFLSALGGTAAVAVVYVLARRLGGRRAGLLAAAFLTLSVFAVTWSQEIRMYAWVSVWGLLALYASLRFWESPRAGWFILYVLAATAGLLSLYLFLTVPVVANLAFLVFWWRAGRSLRTFARWVLAQVAVLALIAPWLAYALPRMPSWSSTEPYSPTFFARLYGTVLATGIGENIDAWLVPTLLVLAVTVACIAVLASQRKTAVQAGGLALLLLALILPPLLVFTITAFPERHFHVPRLAPRYFLPLAATFYALLGWGLTELSRRRPARLGRTLALAGAGVVAAVAVTTILVVLPGRVATDQYVSLVDTLRAHKQGSDKVLLYPDEDWPLFAAKYPGTWDKVPAGMDFSHESVAGLLGPIWDSTEGLWVVTTPKAQEADRQGLVHAWLETHALARTDWDFGETRLTLYSRTPARTATLSDVAPGLQPAAAWSGQAGGAQLEAPRLPLRRYRTGDTLYATVYWLTQPSKPLSLGLRGASAPEEPLPAAPKVTQGPERVVGRLPLTPDLKPGIYSVVLREAGREVADLGSIELVPVGPIQATTSSPQVPLDVRFGEHVQLIGYDLSDQVVTPGDVVQLTLYWQTDGVLTDRYKVFTHLIGQTWNADQGNFLWGQQDNEPQADQLPTTRWAPGEVIADRYRIKLDPKAPAGPYRVEVGMYGLMDGVRLAASDGHDALVLGEVEVRER